MDEEELQDALEDETPEEEEIEEEGEDEEDPDEEDEAEEDDQDPAPAVERRAPASIQIPSGLSAEDREYAESILGSAQALQVVEWIAAKSFASGQASMAVASAGMEQVLSGASAEYRQMVSPRLTTVISRMTPQQRADPHAADDALAVIMAEEARETGEGFWQVVARHSQMRGGASPAPKPRAVIAPKPAATRAPSPSNSGSRPIARQSTGGAAAQDKMLARSLGMSVEDAKRTGVI